MSKVINLVHFGDLSNNASVEVNVAPKIVGIPAHLSNAPRYKAIAVREHATQGIHGFSDF